MEAAEIIAILFNVGALGVNLYSIWILSNGTIVKNRKLRFNLMFVQCFMFLSYGINFSFYYLRNIGKSEYQVVIKIWQLGGNAMFFILYLLNVEILAVFGVLNRNITPDKIRKYKIYGLIFCLASVICYAVTWVIVWLVQNETLIYLFSLVDQFHLDFFCYSIPIFCQCARML